MCTVCRKFDVSVKNRPQIQIAHSKPPQLHKFTTCERSDASEIFHLFIYFADMTDIYTDIHSSVLLGNHRIQRENEL